MKKIKAALIGAGQRGAQAYASYAGRHPEELEFIAVAEPDPRRRNPFKRSFIFRMKIVLKTGKLFSAG